MENRNAPEGPQGKIIASCGHELLGADEGEHVIYGSEDCDAIDGFYPCIVYAHFCSPCARDWRYQGYLFKDQAEADAWLDKERAPRSGTSPRSVREKKE